MQEDHPVAHKSRKLNETEQRYPMHDKEMTAINHCLQAEFVALTQVTSTLTSRIKEGLSHDPLAKILMEMAKEGKTRKFWVEDGLLHTIRNRLYIPKWNNLIREVLKECHDSK
ncbi:hypothetical protein LIER_07138 [Lithospermum erythrorhizon]|uniref:Reverse transcriptase RNase H-like domain-containing protein n=1 Tax=Lithospermum erythrorhizon TaxID=34254 RepID=A0AAV3P7G2_LITER